MPPSSEHEDLKKLLEENLAVARDNNRLLREARRYAILGTVAKVVIWLLILGVPLFFLSTYLGPIMDALSGQAGQGTSTILIGFPSQEQIQQILELYQGESQP